MPFDLSTTGGRLLCLLFTVRCSTFHACGFWTASFCCMTSVPDTTTRSLPINVFHGEGKENIQHEKDHGSVAITPRETRWVSRRSMGQQVDVVLCLFFVAELEGFSSTVRLFYNRLPQGCPGSLPPCSVPACGRPPLLARGQRPARMQRRSRANNK